MAFAGLLAIALAAAAPLLAGPAEAAPVAATSAASRVAIKASVAHAGTRADLTGESSVGETAKLRAEAGKHTHDLEVTVQAAEGDTFTVTLAYGRNGKRVLKSKTLEVAGSSVQVKAGKGTVITLELAPATSKRARIVLPDGDDPLAGL